MADGTRSTDEGLARARALGKQGRWGEAALHLLGLGGAEGGPDVAYLLSQAYLKTGRPEDARRCALVAFDAFRIDGCGEQTMRAATLLGVIAFETGRLPEALDRFRTATELAEAEGDRGHLCRLWNNLGAVHTLTQQYPDAIHCYGRALELAAEVGDVQVRAETLQNLGILYRDAEDYTRAVELFRQAAEAAQQAGNLRQIAFSLVEQGGVAFRMGDLATAERVGRMALLRFDALAHLTGLAETNKLLGMIARERADYVRSAAYLDRAREDASSSGNALLEAEVALESALLRSARGDPTAERALRNVAERFRRLGAVVLAERALAPLRRVA